ncbi:MAG: O-antigen ligase family protein [Solirubrobacteraceae bacterium]|nr:O-antigen ligase family protein [Solirubrobacteraceae bacterium]
MNRLVAPILALSSATIVVVMGASGGAYDLVDRQSAGLVLWWATGLSALVVAAGPRRPGRAGLALLAFAAGITAWTALGLGHTLSTERTATELGRWIVHLAPLLLVGVVLPRSAWRPVIVGVTLGALVICFVGFVERLWPGTFEQTPTVVFTNTAMRLSVPLGYWNALGSWAAMTSVLLLAIASHARVEGSGAAARRGFDGGRRAGAGLSGRLLRAAALAPLPVIATVIYCTYSRSSLLCVGVGIVLLVALAKNRWTAAALSAAALLAGALAATAVSGAPEIADQTGADGRGGVLTMVLISGALLAAAGFGSPALDGWRLPLRQARMAAGATVLLGAIAVGVIGAAKGQDAWDKFSAREGVRTGTSARLTDLSNGSRVEQWRVALDAYKANKGRGEGPGTFELIYNRAAPDEQFVRDAHSAPLEALAEQGWPGFALLIGFMATAVAVVLSATRRVRRAWDRGLVAGAGAAAGAFLTGTAFDWFWEVTALVVVALLLLGALIAAGEPERARAVATDDEGHSSRPAATDDRSTTATRLGRAGIVGASVVAVLALLPGVVGTSEIRRSQGDVQLGDLNAARSHADQAIEIQPWASSPYLQRALVDEQAGQLRAAREGLELAIARDRYDWRLPLVLARVEARAGRPQAALRAYRQAKALRPNGRFFEQR